MRKCRIWMWKFHIWTITCKLDMKFQNLEIKTKKGKLKVLQILLEGNNIIITNTLQHFRHISQSHPHWNVPVTLICLNPSIHGLDRKSRCRTMKFVSVTKCLSTSRTFFRRFPCTKGSSNIFWLLLRLIDWFRGTERVRAWSKITSAHRKCLLRYNCSPANHSSSGTVPIYRTSHHRGKL